MMTSSNDKALLKYVHELEKELGLTHIDTKQHTTPQLVKYACALLTILEKR